MSTPFKMNGISFKEGQIPAKKLNLKGSMAQKNIFTNIASALTGEDNGDAGEEGGGGKGKKLLNNILGGINSFMTGFNQATRPSKDD
jgi:hypothetical protein